MKRLLRLSAVMLLIMALLVPMLTMPASAASAKWNGTSTLQAGKSYVISSAVTMDSKFTIPAKTTLTISSGGSLTVSKGVTVTLNGTLSVSKGGTLKVNGTLNTDEKSTLKVSGKLTYGGSAKLKINGTYTVSSTGTVSGSGTAEINLSSKSQYNSDIDKINDYLSKKNYSKACQLLENAITAYPDKAKSLRSAYSSAVIDWADQLADNKEYLKACSILNSAKNYLTDTSDVDSRYNFYQGYIPVRLASIKVWEGNTWTSETGEDTLGNKYSDIMLFQSYEYGDANYSSKFKIDGKFTNLKATIACQPHIWTYYSKFESDDNILYIYADDVLVFTSDTIYKETEPIEINVDITGASYVTISYSNDNRTYGLICDSATFYKE